MSRETRNQGEGNRDAARRYNEKTEEFTRSEKGRKAVEKGTHLSGEEAKDAEAKEREGLKRAKEKDPQVVRDYEEGEH